MLVARLERVDHRVDRLDVPDDVVRSDVRERVGDVVGEVVASAQRLGDVTCLRPAAEREERDRGRVASDRRVRRRGPEL